MNESHEQTVLRIEAELREAREAYRLSMEAFVDNAGKYELDCEGASKALDYVHACGLKFFNHAENLVSNSSLLGANDDDFHVLGLAETCAAILEVVHNHFDVVRSRAAKCGDVLFSYQPSPHAFANMQRLVRLHLPDDAERLQVLFTKANLPTSGFNKRVGDPMSAREKKSAKITTWIVAGLGLVFLSAMLVIAICFPTPTAFQESVFRLVMALVAAAIGGALPGFITVSLNFPMAAIRAGGALALFLLVYMINPASVVTG